MTDLKSPLVIWCKGLLFLLIGFLGFALILLDAPSIRIAAIFFSKRFFHK